MTAMFKSAAVFIAALAVAASAHAATPRDSLLVKSDWLAQHASDANLVILHSGSPADYAAGHIPGARLVPQGGLAAAPAASGGLTLELPTAADLRTQLQDLGVSDNSRVVIYAAGNQIPAATRLVYTLDAAGFGDRVSLLDGGLAEWKKTGHATSTEATPAHAGVLGPITLQPRSVDADFVRGHLQAPGYTVVDARASNFYDGSQAGSAQGTNPKKGHIPGAKSVPFSSVTTLDADLKSADELAAVFASAGVKTGDHVMVYCHVGQQATAVLFAARTLGVDAKLYDGSFQDWSARDLPVENPSAGAAPAAQ